MHALSFITDVRSGVRFAGYAFFSSRSKFFGAGHTRAHDKAKQILKTIVLNWSRALAPWGAFQL